MSYYLVYVSSATQLFSRAELDEILASSHTNNAKLGITGVLLYKEGNVMQVLEGEETAVRELFATISVDPRHKNVITIVKGSQEASQFSDWSMAFRDLNGPDAQSTPGYSDFLDTRLSSAEFSSNPTRLHKLLNTFKDSMSN